MAVAQELQEKRRFRHALFLAHLAIEKMLKAHVTRATSSPPPKIHNLNRLAELAQLGLDADRDACLRSLNVYQIEGRYPDSLLTPISGPIAESDMAAAREMVQWLNTQL